jgi:hypothetical protein
VGGDHARFGHPPRKDPNTPIHPAITMARAINHAVFIAINEFEVLRGQEIIKYIALS